MRGPVACHSCRRPAATVAARSPGALMMRTSRVARLTPLHGAPTRKGMKLVQYGWQPRCGSAACCCRLPQPPASNCLGRRCIVAAARQGWVCRSIVHESTMHACKAGVSACRARQCCSNAALLPACGPRAAGCWGCCCETRWLLARDCSVRPGGAHIKCQIVPASAALSALAGLFDLLKRFTRLPLTCPMKHWRRLGPVLAAESSGCSCCCTAGGDHARSHCARWLRG